MHRRLGDSIILFAAAGFIMEAVDGRVNLGWALFVWMGFALANDSPTACKWGILVFGACSLVSFWQFTELLLDKRPVEIHTGIVQPSDRLRNLITMGIKTLWSGFNFGGLVVHARQRVRPFWTKRVIITAACFLGIPLVVGAVIHLTTPRYARHDLVVAEFADSVAALRALALGGKSYNLVSIQESIIKTNALILEAQIQTGDHSWRTIKGADYTSSSAWPNHKGMATLRDGTEVSFYTFADTVRGRDGRWIKIEMKLVRPPSPVP